MPRGRHQACDGDAEDEIDDRQEGADIDRAGDQIRQQARGMALVIDAERDLSRIDDDAGEEQPPAGNEGFFPKS